jgi:chemotaxis protein CheY-P-specific phosphatase CheC
MLALEIGEAKKIATMMTMTQSPEEVDPAMKKSAIEELGSIVICAFLSAIADFTGIRLVPTPPQVVNDSFDAVIDFFLAKQALASELAIVFDTCFKRCDNSAEGILVMFPSLELQKMLVDRGKEWLDDIHIGSNATNEQQLS